MWWGRKERSMADNYSQTSFMVPTKNDEQRDWLVAVFGGMDRVQAGDGSAAANLHEEVISIAIDREYDFENGYTPNWRVENDGIWVHADESIDVDLMVVILQAYLKKFHPNSSIGFQWADTCSKPRLDEFGGGAVYIAADDAAFMSTGHWLDEQFVEASQRDSVEQLE
jgi:hypothetical protein